MMSKVMVESELEYVCLCMLGDLDYNVLYGPDISENGVASERRYDEVVLTDRLRDALKRINKSIPDVAIEEAIKRILRTDSQDLVVNNQMFHKLVTNGVNVEVKEADGTVREKLVWLFDFNHIGNNEFLAVNQFTILAEHPPNRRPDIILFVNGLPLVIIELKNPTDESATIESAFNQLGTYRQEIPSVFRYNEVLVISDGLKAEAGTLTSDKERFAPWKTIDSKKQSTTTPQVDMLIQGMLKRQVLLDLVRHFVVYEAQKDTKTGSVKISKKIAQYHQYDAVQKALTSTVKATEENRKAGIVWHTQGSGKSLTMVFYTGKMVLEPELENPTVVVLTDRNDLDDQLFGTFSRCHELLRQEPQQATTREKLKDLLQVSSGGIVFTTIQKFFPEGKSLQYPVLSERKNIIVIADEAHRSQYGFGLKVPKGAEVDLKYGYAKYLRDALPNASFIAFTGTPIETADRSTPAVFGKVIDSYDVNQSVQDGSTVPIFYESRLAKVELKPEERPLIDEEFEEVTEGEEAEGKEHLKSKWSRLEKVVGSPDRIKRIAKDIVDHWENRLSTIDGKAMIVCMSRRICIDMHNEIVRLRPQWYSKDDKQGTIKVIMTGSAADGADWQEHIRNKQRRQELGDRMKDPSDQLKLAIVRDMWLTGFDVPSLNTMYLDKPMKGHTLMQAIARVNRVFGKAKEGGLIVDYIGIATELKQALADYSANDQKLTGIPQEQAVAMMLEHYETTKAFFTEFDYKRFFTAEPKNRMTIIIEAQEQVLTQKDGKERYLKEVTSLLYAFALAVPKEEALAIRDDVGFFQAVRAALVKNTDTREKQKTEEMDTAIKQILSKAIVSDRVIDVFAAAGLKKPNIGILDDEFLAEIKNMPQKNLAFETLKRLLADEIRFRQKKNLVQARSFEEMLDKAIRAYTNKSVDTAQVIQQLMDLARTIKAEPDRAKQMNLSEDEVAFYDALANHPGVKEAMADATLKTIARELVQTVRKNVSIDWTLRESAQAKLRVLVKHILKKYGYPPDKQEKATYTVLDQAKLLCTNWAEDTIA